MSRILAIDYGLKRVGLAVTDPLKIIVSGLPTIETKNVWDFLVSYLNKEKVEKIVFGLATHTDGSFTNIKVNIDSLVSKINKSYPELIIDFQDEAFTSYEARSLIFQSGVKKNKRRDKGLVDKVSAVLILQRYLNHI
jgi:putative holliday junction resolvase